MPPPTATRSVIQVMSISVSGNQLSVKSKVKNKKQNQKQNRVQNKVKVKSNGRGQECPLHTNKSFYGIDAHRIKPLDEKLGKGFLLRLTILSFVRFGIGGGRLQFLLRCGSRRQLRD